MSVLLEFDEGDLVLDLDVDGSPRLVWNFLQLVRARFYTATLIHRILPNRYVQCGCPRGNGTGGTSIYGLLDDCNANKTADSSSSSAAAGYESSTKRFLKHSGTGRSLTPLECQQAGRVVVYPSHSGILDTIGSQFGITIGPGGPDRALDGLSSEKGYFLSLGTVAEDENGLLEKWNQAHVDREGRPYVDIRIRKAYIVHDPFLKRENDYPAPPGLQQYLEQLPVTASRSPSPERPALETVETRISVRELDNDDQDDDAALKQRELQALRRQDKSRAVVLEMLGDLPSADMKAPENVLFVCKLNPVTVAEDLQLIFSRFDPNVQAQVICDSETGQSLQYAFLEFASKQQAVEAYFKMNNALIDDRRIKVDFSQSVAKLWDRHRQRLRMPTYQHGRAGNSNSNSSNNVRGGNHRGRQEQQRDQHAMNRQHGSHLSTQEADAPRNMGRTNDDHYHRDHQRHREKGQETSHHYRARREDRDYSDNHSKHHDNDSRHQPTDRVHSRDKSGGRRRDDFSEYDDGDDRQQEVREETKKRHRDEPKGERSSEASHRSKRRDRHHRRDEESSRDHSRRHRSRSSRNHGRRDDKDRHHDEGRRKHREEKDHDMDRKERKRDSRHKKEDQRERKRHCTSRSRS